jgi:hypothetical protein
VNTSYAASGISLDGEGAPVVAPDLMLAYWNEHRQQLRQSETQRSTMTNYVLIISAALGGLIVQQRFELRTIPISALLILIGSYGAISAAKYHERAEYHLMQARAITHMLESAGHLPGSTTLAEYRQAHYDKYPLLHRIRLHYLWTGLHLAIAAVAVSLLATSLVVGHT